MVRCPLIQTPAWTGSTPYPPRLEPPLSFTPPLSLPPHRTPPPHWAGTAVLPSNSRSIRHKGSVWEKDEDPSMFEAVVEKGSKQLRAKRLKEMKASLLPSEERVLGETGDDLEEIFSHSTPKTGKKPSKRKNTAISPPDIRAESGEDLRSKLTNFTFQPRERMTHADPSVVKASAKVAVHEGVETYRTSNARKTGRKRESVKLTSSSRGQQS